MLMPPIKRVLVKYQNTSNFDKVAKVTYTLPTLFSTKRSFYFLSKSYSFNWRLITFTSTSIFVFLFFFPIFLFLAGFNFLTNKRQLYEKIFYTTT